MPLCRCFYRGREGALFRRRYLHMEIPSAASRKGRLDGDAVERSFLITPAASALLATLPQRLLVLSSPSLPMSLDETYQFDEKSDDEGQDAMDDIDAFEKRMRGEAKAPAKPLQTRVRALPAVATAPSLTARPQPCRRITSPSPPPNPSRRGPHTWRMQARGPCLSTHPRSARPPLQHSGSPRACLPLTVKPPKMTDAQHDAEEAMSAVGDLDKFDRQHAK